MLEVGAVLYRGSTVLVITFVLTLYRLVQLVQTPSHVIEDQTITFSFPTGNSIFFFFFFSTVELQLYGLMD